MPDCIFCKIVRGDIPAYTVYEDDAFLAFLDIHPQSPGHVQVIPKEHYRWVWDVPEYTAYFALVRRIAKAAQKAFGTDEIHLRVMGEEVPHAHVWVYPAPSRTQGDPNDFAGNLARLRAALA